MFTCFNAYNIPVARIRGRVCKTNLPSNTAFRGFGGPQGVMMGEEIVEKIALVLDVRPEKVRLQYIHVRVHVRTHACTHLEHRSRLLRIFSHCVVQQCLRSQIRTLNMVQEGDITTYNMPVENCTVNECWTQVLEQSQFEERLNGIQRFNG